MLWNQKTLRQRSYKYRFKFMCVKIRRFENDKCMCRAVKLFPNSMLSVDVTNTLEVQCSKVTLFITQSLTQHFTDTAPILVLY